MITYAQNINLKTLLQATFVSPKCMHLNVKQHNFTK